MASSDYSKAGDLLGGLLDIAGIGGNSEIARIFQSWQLVVGADLASHSAIEDIRNGCVIVIVDHPAWLQLIQQREQYFLQRLQRDYPSLKLERMLLKVGKPQFIALKAKKTAPEEKKIEEAASQPEEKDYVPQEGKQDFLDSMNKLKRTIEQSDSTGRTGKES
ncbi:DciA family protein [Spirochaeta dissipatitropha]